MMAQRQHSFALLLALLLACWSGPAAALLQQGRQSQSGKELRMQDVQTSDGDTADQDEAGEDEDDDDQEEDDESSASGPKKVALAQAQPNFVVKDAKQAEVPAGISNEKEDDEQAPAGISKDEENQVIAPSEKKPKNDVQAAEEELASNLQEQSELKQRMKYFSDGPKSEEDIEASAKLVANETESAALADMMSTMWKEMRVFEVPFFIEHAEEEMHHLKHEQQSLEAKLAKAKGKEVDSEQAKEKKKKDEGEAAKKAGKHKKDKHADAATTDAASLQNGVAPSAWNFWQMSSKKQEEFFAGSLAYLVGGILLAFLYNKARASNPKVFTPEPRFDKEVNSKDFSFNIFGCFGAPNICVTGCCCPIMRWADTMDRNDIVPFWKAFIAFFVLTLLHCYTMGISSLLAIVLGVVYRQKLRKSYDIESGTPVSIIQDIFVWLCCTPCAIIQEAREESIQRSVPGV